MRDGLASDSRLQSTSQYADADWIQKDPTFIGLVSMLTGLTEISDVQADCRRLYQRGIDLLGLTKRARYPDPRIEANFRDTGRSTRGAQAA